MGWSRQITLRILEQRDGNNARSYHGCIDEDWGESRDGAANSRIV